MTNPAHPMRHARPDAGPRVVIAGAGLMGRWHADAAARAGGRVVGICDPNEQAARELAARVQADRVEARLESLLALATPDVVHICTPLATHAELSECALVGGADVLVEKPLAADAAQTERLLALAQKHARVLCPVHQLAFQPWINEPERTGQILSIDYDTCSAGALNRGARAADEVANEILPHPLSLFEQLLNRLGEAADPDEAGEADDSGDRLALGALAWRAERPRSGELRAQATTAGGVSLSIGISLQGRPPRHELRVTGSRGTLHADLFHGFAWREGETTSRRYKIARPFWLAAHQIGSAAVNLARRAARLEPAYPGLRKLVADFYAFRGADPDSRRRSPLSAAHTLAVARARDAILAAS